MKKEWIVEIIYIITALVFIGICVSGRKEPAEAVTEAGITATPAVDVTKEPEEMGDEGLQATPEVKDESVTPWPEIADTIVEDRLPPEVQEEVSEKTGDETRVEDPNDGQDGSRDGNQGGSQGENQDGSGDGTGEDVADSGETEVGKMPGAIEIVNENYDEYDNTEYSWWFRRKENHEPSGSSEEFPLISYSAYYLDETATEEDKVMYLTFDCGYENGFTPSILDTLKEKNVKATFFVAQHFVESHPEYVARMKEEGHMVGNHTVRHLSSPELTPEELVVELETVAATMERLTGYRMDPYFRPPMGRYSERALKVAQDMGYTSLFWSIAYYDYDRNDQPGKEYVVDHFDTYHHNGSIILMHNISESNAEALGDVIDLIRDAGYRFGEVSELLEQ